MSQLSHAQFPLRRHPNLLVDHRRSRSAAVAEPRGANGEAVTGSGGRLHFGMVAGIKSERWPTSNRNPRPDCLGIRNPVLEMRGFLSQSLSCDPSGSWSAWGFLTPGRMPKILWGGGRRIFRGACRARRAGPVALVLGAISQKGDNGLDKQAEALSEESRRCPRWPKLSRGPQAITHSQGILS